MADRRDVWITGLGVISAIGIGLPAFREGLRANASPVKRIDRFDPSPFRSQVAAQVDDFDPADHMDARAVRGLDRFSPVRPRDRPDGDGRCRASSPGSAGRPRPTGSGSTSGPRWAASPSRRASTRSTSTAACGRSPPPSRSRCSAARPRPTSGSRSTSAGRSSRPPTRAPRAPSRSARRCDAIRSGEIDAAIAGGVECPLSPLAFGAFDLIRALSSHRNDDPSARLAADGRRPRRLRHGRGRRPAGARGGGPGGAARGAAVRAGAGLRRDVRRPPHGPAAGGRSRGGPGGADRARGRRRLAGRDRLGQRACLVHADRRHRGGAGAGRRRWATPRRPSR